MANAVPTMLKVAIVGCAGKKEEAKLMTAPLFKAMVEKCKEMVETIAKEHRKTLADIQLVSGGSAWADHCAVTLFNTLKYGGLTLYLPCQWRPLNGEFEDTHERNPMRNPGWLLNLLHRQMSTKLGHSTLQDIQTALQHQDATLCTSYPGFHPRNQAIAKSCDVLIAFTWSSSGVPKAGSGTAFTWNATSPEKCRIHVDLASLTTLE